MKTKEFIKKKYKYLILAILLAIFILIAKNVFKKELFDFDKILYDFLVSHRNGVLNVFFTTITELGSAEFLILFTILSVIFIKNKLYRILIPINLTFIGILNFVLKNIFVRPRPNILRLIEENGYSFPSGHAMASTAFYGLLIVFVFKHIQKKKLKYLFCTILTIIIVFIDISRIYVGVHYASDVIAGSCLSISYLIILIRLIEGQLKLKENKEEINQDEK